MRYIKGQYVDSIQVKHPDGKERKIDIWMNPETRKLFGLINMEVDAELNFANDPYEKDVGIVFENTFSGLPK